MLLRSLILTPKVNDRIRAEAIIDPNPKVFKSCYLQLVLNIDNEFEVLENPDRVCTEAEITAATEYGKYIINSTMAAIENTDNEVKRLAMNMTAIQYSDYKHYQETLTQFAKYVYMHATQDGLYKTALSDYVRGYFKRSNSLGKNQKTMREDVINMVISLYGRHPDTYKFPR